jgi:phage FluMu protein Com
MADGSLREVRCQCGALLMKVSHDISGMVEVVCNKCKVLNHIHYRVEVKQANESDS